ncbi:hypothetical protein T09_3383 [Trichinella sp. T9]|nr:hypothetical protein T09_3383 [Trichinella sp. T9]
MHLYFYNDWSVGWAIVQSITIAFEIYKKSNIYALMLSSDSSEKKSVFLSKLQFFKWFPVLIRLILYKRDNVATKQKVGERQLTFSAIPACLNR